MDPVSRVVRRAAASAVLVLSVASCGGQYGPSARVLGGPCRHGEVFRVATVGAATIRCEMVEGTSIHSADPATAARFEWTVVDPDEVALGAVTGQSVRADGSSTLAPMMTVAARYFENMSVSINGNEAVRLAVGVSGTGGGFEKFCRGETDLSNASRRIKESESELCRERGVDFEEFLVALDGLAVVVNHDNDWASCLTMEELGAIWGPDSTLGSWAQVREGFPDEPLRLFGAGTDSGTFDSFSELVGGSAKALRKDVDTSEDDNVTVRGVSSAVGGIGYFGLSYAVENADAVRAVAVDAGDGCTEPVESSVQDGSYPLARPLYVYAKVASVRGKPGVGAFLEFLARHSEQIAHDAQFVPLDGDDADEFVRRTAALRGA